jgi:hypothetical protein
MVGRARVAHRGGGGTRQPATEASEGGGSVATEHREGFMAG